MKISVALFYTLILSVIILPLCVSNSFSETNEENISFSLTKDEFQKIIQNQTDQLVEEGYGSTVLSQVVSLGGVALGAIIAILGSLGVNSWLTNKDIRAIEALILKDVRRIKRNVEYNHKECVKIINDPTIRLQFIQNITTVPDLQNLQELGSEQVFNYWNTIISSSKLIHLGSEKISQIQSCYDLTQDMNHDINAIQNGGRLKNSILASHGAKIDITNHLFGGTRNESDASDVLLDLCKGLKSMHEEYHKILFGTLKVFGCIDGELDTLDCEND